MSHRGPDGSGVYQEPKIALGHRRLAIIDLSETGKQPMFSDKNSHIIVYNGELYNYVEIRDGLESEGTSFSTQSDTEVLLKSYISRGPEVLSSFNGMFAFAIWDIKKQQLFVARDRFGIKPLYYIVDDSFIAFASEIKALLPLMKSLEPNEGIIYDFLTSGRVDHLDETFFKGIHRFPAGHYATVDDSGLSVEKWYDLEQRVLSLQSRLPSRSIDEHSTVVRKMFSDAVRIRLRSDVPVGSCLSGGIDSSSIVCEVASIIPDQDRKNFQTYSAVYGDWFKESEHRHVDTVIRSTNMISNRTTPTFKKWQSQFSGFVYHQEEPVGSSSPFTQYCVMELAHSKGAKVLLDGQGADEILAGYDYMAGYFMAELLTRGKLYSLLREFAAQLRRRNTTGLKAFGFQFLPKKLKKAFSPKDTIFLSSSLKRTFSHRTLVDDLLYYEKSLNSALIHHILFKLQHLLRWEDRNAMAFSVETRVPFLDYQLVEYILALPAEFKLRRGITKWIFRKAVSDLLPEQILSRKDKIGFASPEVEWMNESEFELRNELRKNPHPLLQKYVDTKVLQRTLESDSGYDKSTSRQLARIISLDSWLKAFF